MEWEFNAEQVVTGDVAYGLEHFRRDLDEEVRLNMALADDLQHARAFNLIYDMCYALATDCKLDEFLSAYAYDPPTCQFLRELQPLMQGNVEMLGAILQRMIMDGVEAGMSLDCAVEVAAEKHRAAASPARSPAQTSSSPMTDSPTG